MNKQLKSKVMTLAKSARSWAMEEAARVDNYNKFDLCQWCAIATGKLHVELHNAEIESMIGVCNDSQHGSHAFNIVDDYIVDITATQFYEFAQTPIVMMHSKMAERYWYYGITEMFANVDQLRKHQVSTKWPKSQWTYPSKKLILR